MFQIELLMPAIDWIEESILRVDFTKAQEPPRQFAQASLETTDPIQNIDTLFLVGIVILAVFMLQLILGTLFSWSTKMTYINRFLQRYFGWELAIRFILEAYIEALLVSFLRIKYMTWQTTSESILTILAFVIAIVLISFFVYSTLILFKYYKDIDEPWFKSKYGELTHGM